MLERRRGAHLGRAQVREDGSALVWLPQRRVDVPGGDGEAAYVFQFYERRDDAEEIRIPPHDLFGGCYWLAVSCARGGGEICVPRADARWRFWLVL